MKNLCKILSVCFALALMLSLASVAFAADPVGTEGNPYVFEDGFFAFPVNLEAKADSIVYFTFNADEAGYININNVYIDNWDGFYAEFYYNSNTYTFSMEEGGTVIIPEMVFAGEAVLIGVSVKGMDGTPVDSLIDFMCDVSGTASDAFIDYSAAMDMFWNSLPLEFSLDSGSTVYFRNADAWKYAAGLLVTTENEDDISNISVVMNGMTITDTNGNKKIELTPAPDSNDMMGAVILGISNTDYSGNPIKLTISISNNAESECDHTNKTSVGATAPGCHTDGILAHEVCADCGSLFINDVMVDSVVDVAPNQPYSVLGTVTCTEPGNIAHYHCDGCNKNFDWDWETDTYTELTSIASDALGHNMESYEAQEPSCCGEGNYEWHWCSNCYEYFKDVEGNEAYASYEEIWIAADPDAHKWVLAEEVDYEPLEGNVPALHTSKELVYKCDCFNCWMVEAKDLTTTMLTAPSCGTLVFHEATPASVSAEGNVAHYSCPGCNKLFIDAEGVTEVAAADVVIAKLPGETTKPADTTTTPETTAPAVDTKPEGASPDTGDRAFICAIVIMVAMAAVICVVSFSRKKSH